MAGEIQTVLSQTLHVISLSFQENAGVVSLVTLETFDSFSQFSKNNHPFIQRYIV